MYQGCIEGNCLKIIHKSEQNLTEYIKFLEQQYGIKMTQINKIFHCIQNDKVYFLCKDCDFAYFLAETASYFNQHIGV